MQSSNLVVSLDMRRARKDGTYPLILRLGHQERTIPIPLGIYIKEGDWDGESRKVKKSYSDVSSVTRLNNLIQKRKAEAMDMLLKLHDSGEAGAMSAKAIKEKLMNQGQIHAQSFYAYAHELIAELRKANRIGTARSYEGVISVLKTFNKGKPLPKNKGGYAMRVRQEKASNERKADKSQDLRFHEITYAYLAKFETYHKAQGNGTNGLAVYMRTIRAIYNKAIKSGLIDKALYPFDDYKVKTAPTEKRALDADYIAKIIALDLPPDHLCFNARNYFLASYMMYGMNFADMAFLRKSDLVNGRIYYRRRKTSKLYDIKITPGLERILSYYREQQTGSPYIFPILKRDSPLLQERDIQWARKRYNKKLKTVAEMCGIERNLTSYVSRHSFATQAIMQKVPVNAISSMLGHSSLKTTEIYLKSLPTAFFDEFNLLIVQSICKSQLNEMSNVNV